MKVSLFQFFLDLCHTLGDVLMLKEERREKKGWMEREREGWRDGGGRGGREEVYMFISSCQIFPH